jgi:hypothetical protein
MRPLGRMNVAGRPTRTNAAEAAVDREFLLGEMDRSRSRMLPSMS